jgi:ABC-type transporter Mla subunit MlaD
MVAGRRAVPNLGRFRGALPCEGPAGSDGARRRYASLPVTEEAPKQSAAASAAEKVRAIVEAAESSAAELEAEARADAAHIRAEAQGEADSRLTRAREVAARLAERAGELERQVADIRASIASLAKDLEELRGEAEPAANAALREGEPVASVATEDEEAGVDETIAAAEAAAAREPEDAEELAEEPVTQPASGEGARVIALNMALRGTPRDETARYLAENFELDDPDALLDDVYSQAGGG